METFQAKQAPGLDPGWMPVGAWKMRQTRKSGAQKLGAQLQFHAIAL
jgi:hypothetical protein